MELTIDWGVVVFRVSAIVLGMLLLALQFGFTYCHDFSMPTVLKAHFNKLFPKPPSESNLDLCHCAGSFPQRY